MNRRETLKTVLIGTLAGTTMGALGCKTDPKEEGLIDANSKLYGRTPEEIEYDEKLFAEEFLNEHELETIAILCDIILPATDSAGSANDAKVPAFIDFIVKDLPNNQLPLRGGLMWLDLESSTRFDKQFKALTDAQQIEIVDDIAYPDPDKKKPAMASGIKFFNLMRNLTLTGYYTTRMGVDDLGYKGNYANVWDGVPADILKDHDVDYDPEWLAKCVDQSKRDEIAVWDDKGNLLS